MGRGVRRRTRPYKGKVTAYDSPIYIADAALYLKATKPDLKITNPYELDDKQFDAAVDLLKTQQTLIGEYWSDYTKEVQALRERRLRARHHLAGHRQPDQRATRRSTVDAIVPKEGSTGWSDTWMVSAKAAHPNCMYKWMDWIISPKVNAQVAEWFGEAPAQTKACDRDRRQEASATTYHALDPAYADQISYWTTPTKDCGDDRGNDLQGLRGLDAGLDRDQGLTAVQEAARACPAGGAGPGRRSRGWPAFLHRAPGLRLAGLLSAPMLWLVVAYLGSLAVMFATAFWSVDTLHRRVIRQPTLDNFRTLLTEPVYRTIALRSLGVAAAVTVVDALIALPMAFYMAKVARPRARAAAGRRDPHPAVGQLPGQGVRVAGHAGRGRRRSTGRWGRSACAGPGYGAGRDR